MDNDSVLYLLTDMLVNGVLDRILEKHKISSSILS